MITLIWSSNCSSYSLLTLDIRHLPSFHSHLILGLPRNNLVPIALLESQVPLLLAFIFHCHESGMNLQTSLVVRMGISKSSLKRYPTADWVAFRLHHKLAFSLPCSTALQSKENEFLSFSIVVNKMKFWSI